MLLVTCRNNGGFFMILCFIFYSGCIIGSFLAVAASRLPQGQSLLLPRSHCTHCGHTLAFYELMPLFSQLLLGNRCRYCRQPIGISLAVMESLSGIILLLYSRVFGTLPFGLPLLFLLYMGLTLAYTDYLYLIVEPKLMYGFTFLIVVSNELSGRLLTYHPLAALLVVVLLVFIQQLIPDGLGGGDVRLLTIWAFFLGIFETAILIFFASLIALLFCVITRRHKNSDLRYLPFVPFLCIGLILTIVRYYLS
ncbi:hypothetical protein CBF27_11935 [Vagococcus acidifermentans]|uniref:Peptidase A24A N-terminal domain-containing protein n=2 Tax=Vagococcus acidifermentans TaxID=564710 RepID=A0A430ANS5_9ENTE|nr:hypothetical protein CBF27_11935 [Vagococcus acidifermentans]